VLFDVDDFKAFNDHYGHPEGDDALRRVAQAIAESCRTQDTAYRYGGEEFLVLLRREGIDGAIIAAERMRTAVESCRIPHRLSPHGVVTVSAGVAACSEATLTRLGLLDVTDQALYQAKSAGRNVVAGAAMPRLQENAKAP